MAHYELNKFTGEQERVDALVPQASDITDDYTVRPQDEYLPVDATAKAIVITLLPSNQEYKGKIVEPSKRDASANYVTITAAGTDLINGSATLIIQFQYSAPRLCADGVGGWAIL